MGVKRKPDTILKKDLIIGNCDVVCDSWINVESQYDTKQCRAGISWDGWDHFWTLSESNFMSIICTVLSAHLELFHLESAELGALMTACNCSITHTNVHSLPLSKQNHFISFIFNSCRPDCQCLNIAANRVRSFKSREQREQCHIHTQRHQLSSSLPRHCEWKLLSPQPWKNLSSVSFS